VSLQNSKIAFQSKSNKELRLAAHLFRAMQYPLLVSFGKFIMKVVQITKLPLQPLIRSTIFKQFCGGIDFEECLDTVRKLHSYNVKSYITYAAEGKEIEKDFERSTRELVELVGKLKEHSEIPFTVFKITAFARFKLLQKISAKESLNKAEEEEYNRVLERMQRLCSACHDKGIPVNVDAEESWIQPAIDDVVALMMKKYNGKKTIVFNSFQMYRKDRMNFLVDSHQKAKRDNYFFGAKLVRGAYLERERARAKRHGYASPIHETKADTDNAYNKAVQFCVKNIENSMLVTGTHNVRSTEFLAQIMNDEGLSKDDPRIYCAQLMGMSDNITFNMADVGYTAVKYIPYGPVMDVIPYLIRRANENSSIKGQMGRELKLINEELERRKKSA